MLLIIEHIKICQASLHIIDNYLLSKGIIHISLSILFKFNKHITTCSDGIAVMSSVLHVHYALRDMGSNPVAFLTFIYNYFEDSTAVRGRLRHNSDIFFIILVYIYMIKCFISTYTLIWSYFI